MENRTAGGFLILRTSFRNLAGKDETLTTDFKDAHDRHWEDAGSLFRDSRWANADHLYGLAAECGLKALMRCFGMGFDTVRDRPSQTDDRVHADKAWTRYESYRSGHPSGVRYCLPSVNPFSNWSADQRYWHRNGFTKCQTEEHRKGAELVRDLLNKAFLEGLI